MRRDNYFAEGSNRASEVKTPNDRAVLTAGLKSRPSKIEVAKNPLTGERRRLP
jgi:hypothetical protein